MVNDDINCFLTAALQGIMLDHAGDESAVGRGHAGGVRYIYMYPNTDQENGVLTTLHI